MTLMTFCNVLPTHPFHKPLRFRVPFGADPFPRDVQLLQYYVFTDLAVEHLAGLHGTCW